MTEIEKLYSEAFEDGVNYAIEKMFAEEEKKGIFKKAGEWIKNKYWEAGKGKGFLGLMDEVPATEAGKEAGKKLNWGRLGKRVGVPAVVAAVPTALAIRHHNKKKAAEAEAEKNYSEGFLDGVGYAQKMFGDEATTINDILKEESEGAKKDNIFKRGWNKLTNDIWEKGKGLRDEATNDAGEKVKKLNWKRLGKRAGVIGGGTALVAVPTALAIRHHNKKKSC